MKDNMPTLKEVFDANDQMREFGLQWLMLHFVGYTMEDFEKYADEMMADDDVKETIEAMASVIEYALKQLKRSKK